MKLEYKGPAIEAQPFNITASEFSGNIALEVYVGLRLISQKDCDDPPCHEMFIIPKATAGEMLRVVTWDIAGNEQKLELPIVSQPQREKGADI